MRCAWHNGIIIVINWVWLCAGVARRAKHKYTCYRSFIHSYISSGVGYTCRLSWPIIYLLINTCYADVRLCVIHCRRRCAIVPSNNSSILWCVCVWRRKRAKRVGVVPARIEWWKRSTTAQRPKRINRHNNMYDVRWFYINTFRWWLINDATKWCAANWWWHISRSLPQPPTWITFSIH